MDEVPASPPVLVLSCEHGGRRVPARWKHVFVDAAEALSSHRGWDPGALGLARRLSRSLGAPLIAATVTRLLVDANRSEGHPRLFSPWTRALDPVQRSRIVATHHRPHRAAVAATVARGLESAGTVLHVGVHTFTPVLGGRRREVDLGILYDPARVPERDLARELLRSLRERLPGLAIRANAPYRGVSDGLTTSLRRRFPEARYSGLELEVGQGLLDTRGKVPAPVVAALVASIRRVLGVPP